MQVHTEELVRRVASLTGQDSTAVSAVVAALADEIIASMDEGDTIVWRKFGRFNKAKRKRPVKRHAAGRVHKRNRYQIKFTLCKEMDNNINHYEEFLDVIRVPNPQDQSSENHGDGGAE